jgi:hypothetical protein
LTGQDFEEAGAGYRIDVDNYGGSPLIGGFPYDQDILPGKLSIKIRLENLSLKAQRDVFLM